MSISELKAKYQGIVSDCRKAEKTEDTVTARYNAMASLEREQNTFMESVVDATERAAAWRIYHGAWNAIAFPAGEEGTAFMADFDAKEE